MAQSFGFSIPKNILKLWVGSFVFAIANIIYYKYFTSLGFMESYYDAFTFSFNRDSLKVFLPNIYKLEDGSLDNELTNITGISYFYYYLIPKISLSYTELSLVVNTFLFVATVFCIYKINSVLVIKNKWLFLLFLNPQFIYYSQTINKEPFTIFFFFCAAYLIISKRYIYLLFFTMLFFIIRDYHALYVVWLIYLYRSRTLSVFYSRLTVLYISISIISTIMLNSKIVNLSGVGNTSNLIISLDAQYGIGSLLFLPFRFLQNLYAQFVNTFMFVDQDGLIILYSLKEIVPNLLLILFFKRLVNKSVNIKRWFYGPEKIYFLAAISFSLIVSLNPIVHYRYLFPLITVFLLIATNRSYVYNHKIMR